MGTQSAQRYSVSFMAELGVEPEALSAHIGVLVFAGENHKIFV